MLYQKLYNQSRHIEENLVGYQKVLHSSMTERYVEYFYIYASIKDLMSLVNLTISFVFNIYEI